MVLVVVFSNILYDGNIGFVDNSNVKYKRQSNPFLLLELKDMKKLEVVLFIKLRF